jgi:hypothetical protein
MAKSCARKDHGPRDRAGARTRWPAHHAGQPAGERPVAGNDDGDAGELDARRDDKSVRVVIVIAAAKLFSAGHDLKQMTAHRKDADGGKAFFEKTFAVCSRLMQSIVRHPKPVIAEIDGIATAAGCQLVASAISPSPRTARLSASTASTSACSARRRAWRWCAD